MVRDPLFSAFRPLLLGFTLQTPVTACFVREPHAGRGIAVLGQTCRRRATSSPLGTLALNEEEDWPGVLESLTISSTHFSRGYRLHAQRVPTALGVL